MAVPYWIEATPLLRSNPTASNFTLSTAGFKASAIIYAPATDTITSVVFRVSGGGGVAQTYRVGFQGVSGGDPDGTWAGGGNAYQDITINGAGTYTATFGTGAAITQGTAFAFVVDSTSTVLPSAIITIGFSNTVQRIDYTSNYNNSTWARGNVHPNLKYVSATQSYGLLYTTNSNVTVATGNEIAFAVSLPAGFASSVTIKGAVVSIASMTPGGTFDVLWYPGLLTTDTTATTLTSAFSGSNQSNAAGLMFLPFANDLVLTPGVAASGRLSLKNNSGANISYVVMAYSNASDMSCLPFGTNNKTSTRAGGAGNWTDTLTQVAMNAGLWVASQVGGGLFVPAGMTGGMR